MNVIEADLAAVVSVLLALPLVALVAVVLADILRRSDLTMVRKAVYGMVAVLVVPASLVYLLSRPTSIVRHHDRRGPDWRSDLVAHLEASSMGRPVVGPGQERQLAERVRALATPRTPSGPPPS
jgi:hypothetical protein